MLYTVAPKDAFTSFLSLNILKKSCFLILKFTLKNSRYITFAACASYTSLALVLP